MVTWTTELYTAWLPDFRLIQLLHQTCRFRSLAGVKWYSYAEDAKAASNPTSSGHGPFGKNTQKVCTTLCVFGIFRLRRPGCIRVLSIRFEIIMASLKNRDPHLGRMNWALHTSPADKLGTPLFNIFRNNSIGVYRVKQVYHGLRSTVYWSFRQTLKSKALVYTI